MPEATKEISLTQIPWNRKSEWEDVYCDAYSGDFVRQKKALQILKVWSLDYNICPPGLDATYLALNTILKDKTFTKNCDNELDHHELQMIYSSILMRFLNHMLEEDKKNMESMYTRGKKMDIPDWIINLRHVTAHGKILPALDLLRNGMVWLMNWLKDNYWELGKRVMTDWEKKRTNKSVMQEKINGLLTIYLLLKEAKLMKTKKVKDIDEDKREKILSFNDFTVSAFKKETSPWENQKSEEQIKRDINEMKNLAISDATNKILSKLREFFKWPYANYQPLKMIADFLLTDSINHDGCRYEMWTTLLKKFHTHNYFMPFLDVLTKITFGSEKLNEKGNFCGKWISYLLESLVKRHKMEELKNSILTDPTNTNKTPKISAQERRILKTLLLRKGLKLNVSESNVAVCAALTARVEKRHPFLKNSIRLLTYRPISKKEIIHLIQNITENPNKYSIPCLELLFLLIDDEEDMKTEKADITKVIKILRGEEVDFVHNLTKIYTLESLKDKNLVEDNFDQSPKKHIVDSDDDDDDEDDKMERFIEINKCPIHKNESECPWRTCDGFDWHGCPADKTPWDHLGLPSPFEMVPYTGTEESKLKIKRVKPSDETYFFMGGIRWNRVEQETPQKVPEIKTSPEKLNGSINDEMSVDD